MTDSQAADDPTVAALVDAAEGRFAQDGFVKASLRAVMRDAGTDPGAVHYHFGGREALAAAVLDRLLVPLNDQRLQLLAEVAGRRGGDDVRPLIEALIRPDIELAQALDARGAGRARLLGSIYLDPTLFVLRQVEERFAPVAQAFQPRLIEALPDHAPELLAWRIRWCLFGTVGTVLSDPTEPFRLEPEQLLRRLVDTITPAIAAPTA